MSSAHSSAATRDRHGLVPAASRHACARSDRRGARLRGICDACRGARRPRSARRLAAPRFSRRVPRLAAVTCDRRCRHHDGRDRDRRAARRVGDSPGPAILRDAAAARLSSRSTSACRSARSPPCVLSAAGRRCCSLVGASSSATRRSTTPAARSGAAAGADDQPEEDASKGRIGGLVFGTRGNARRRARIVFPAAAGAPAAAGRRQHLGARHRRRSVRVAAETERRREGLERRSFRATAACSIGSTAGCLPRRSTTCSSGICSSR